MSTRTSARCGGTVPKENTNALPERRERYAQWPMSPRKYPLVFQAPICPAGLRRIAVGVGP